MKSPVLIPVLSLLPAAAFALGYHPGPDYRVAPPAASQGFYESYQDWDAACDNTGTCRIAGYQGDGEIEHPVSVLFTRQAGSNAPVVGQIAVAPDFTDNASDLKLADKSELRLNGKTLGTLRFNQDGYGKLSSAQTQALLAALRRDAKIEVVSGAQKWMLSDNGAAAAMLKVDEFQGRLNTPSALIGKGQSNRAVLPPQAAPKIRATAVPQKGEYTLKKGTAKHKAVMALLQKSNNGREDGDPFDRCPGLHEAEWQGDITVYPLNAKQVLVDTSCISGAYQGTSFNAVMDKKLTRVEQVLPRQYGGFGGFDPKTATLSGSFKGRGLGDCWSGQSAVWNGHTFVRSSEDTTGQCKGFLGGAWTLPVFVSKPR